MWCVRWCWSWIDLVVTGFASSVSLIDNSRK